MDGSVGTPNTIRPETATTPGSASELFGASEVYVANGGTTGFAPLMLPTGT
jgi:hypothetical protein